MGMEPQNQCMVVVDPSAASFITELRSRGLYVKPANNEVADGIRVVGSLLAKRNIRINKDNCKGLISEMQSYVWDDKAAERGEENPVKQKDHGCFKILLLYGPAKVADRSIGGSQMSKKKTSRQTRTATKQNMNQRAPVTTMDAFSNPAARIGLGTMDLLQATEYPRITSCLQVFTGRTGSYRIS